MPLRDRAVLVIDGGGSTAQFDLLINFEETTELQKSFIMAERGQYVQEVANHVAGGIGIGDPDERRAGWWIDGGAGLETFTLTFQAGMEEESVTWGDGAGGSGASSVTPTDASGAEVHPMDKKQVLEYWLRRTKTDSLNPAQLHWGQWTNGDVGASAGVYNQPIPVAVRDDSLPSPNPDESVAYFEGTITLARIAQFPDPTSIPEWIQDRAAKIQEQLDGIFDR